MVHRGSEFAWRLIKFTLLQSTGKSWQVGVTAWTSGWSLGDKGTCQFGCSGVHVEIEDGIRQHGARSLGISDAMLKCSRLHPVCTTGRRESCRELKCCEYQAGAWIR